MEKTERRLTVAVGELNMQTAEFRIIWHSDDPETVARVLQLLLTPQESRKKEVHADE